MLDVLPDLSQRLLFTCPECQTEGITNLCVADKREVVEVTCDYCQRVAVVAVGVEEA
jgi:transcription elongation factor Elf1